MTARETLEAAQRAYISAGNAHQEAARRLADARAEVDRLTAQVAAADPDDSSFARLVAKRDTARARLEPLAARAKAAEQGELAARGPVLAAQVAVANENGAAIEARGRAVTARRAERDDRFARELVADLLELQELEREALQARNEVARLQGLPAAAYLPLPGSVWRVSPFLLPNLLLQCDPLVAAVNRAQSAARGGK